MDGIANTMMVETGSSMTSEDGNGEPTVSLPDFTVTNKPRPAGRPFKAEWEAMTSEDVYNILLLNTSNRPPRPAHRADLLQKMRDDRYNYENPEPIIIGWNDVLIDGQHRLEAAFEYCTETGKKVKFYVIRNVDPDVYNYVNQGKSRTTSDIFSKTIGTTKDEKTSDGQQKSKVDRNIVAVAMAMLRSGTDSLPAALRNDPGAQANYTVKHRVAIETVLAFYPNKRSRNQVSIYSTPIAAAFVNAGNLYGLIRVVPLVKRMVSQEWLKGDDGQPDSIRLLRDLIVSAKTAKARSRFLDRDLYRYAVSAIRSALSPPKHWVERLIPSDRNFGEAVEWERRIREQGTPEK